MAMRGLTLLQKMNCCGLSRRSNTESEDNERINENRAHATHLRRPTDTKHIVLTIEGLKCGCCGDSGISRTLDQIPGVENYQVNVVLARAEFDLDIRTTTVGLVRRKLTVATGYTFKQYFPPDGQVLEFVVDDPAEIDQVCHSATGPCTARSEGISNGCWIGNGGPVAYSDNCVCTPSLTRFLFHRQEDLTA